MKQGNKKDYRIGTNFKTGKEALVKRNKNGLMALREASRALFENG